MAGSQFEDVLARQALGWRIHKWMWLVIKINHQQCFIIHDLNACKCQSSEHFLHFVGFQVRGQLQRTQESTHGIAGGQGVAFSLGDFGHEVEQLTRRAEFFASRARYADALLLVDQALHLEPKRPELHLGWARRVSKHMLEKREYVARSNSMQAWIENRR